jgi:Holliday junction resolvasome RuvABC endonuclease subunit
VTVVVGIDVGMSKASFSVWNEDKLELLADHFVNANYRRSYALRVLAEKISTSLGPWYPDHVFIEQNLVGNNVKYSINLSQMVGAIAAEMDRNEWPVEFANVSAWKKSIIGKGNASKEDIRVWVDQGYPEYTASCDGVQDRYDAFCVGLYGARMVAIANDLATGRHIL